METSCQSCGRDIPYPAVDLDYQLYRLGWKGFQHLCATILRESMGQTLQVFSDVNDAGRDGAFHGIWRPVKGEVFKGKFTIQCKHSSQADQKLGLKSLAEEIEKAAKRAARGLAENYLLLTNRKVSAVTAEEIEKAFESIKGVKRAKVYGRDWIEQQIHENKSVRMHVPRIYRLGDLTQILDDRAHDQARAILSELGDDFSRFVVTEAHRQSVKAITNKGFVFLLGEPCCGKSTIAAALALAAADKWNCELIRITDPRDFSRHWNPKRIDQFFWVDDAFGSTQYERDLAVAWNRVFPGLETAIRQGNKAVFTSRDYVYSAAMSDLKDISLPELRDSQVVIHVEELTIREKEQILYNHIKLGTQPKEAKRRLKNHLADIASHNRFLPETARRLSNPLFTKEVLFNRESLLNFVSNMKQFLLDTLRTIGTANAAATALVFMRRGRLECDLTLTEKDKSALERLGATVSDVRQALKDLESTLFIKSEEEQAHFWRFKHPSIRDAFGTLIADDPALADIYLESTPVRSLALEITCGGPDLEGVKLKVPTGKFAIVLSRLAELKFSDPADFAVLLGFLRNRCGKQFLAEFLSMHPRFLPKLEYGAWMVYDKEVRLASLLHSYNLLPEKERRRLANAIRTLTMDYGDAACYDVPEIRAVLTTEEHRKLRKVVEARIFGALRRDITDTKERCIKNQQNAWSAFLQVNKNLECLAKEFPSATFQKRIAKVKRRVRRIEMGLYRKRKKTAESLTSDTAESEGSARSIFDDVDE